MTVTHTVQLNNKASIPAVGLGVYQTEPGDETYQAVLSALKLGYRHVDTAQYYNNEADVGKAVRDSGIPRSEVFITTKLWSSEWGYDKATQSIQKSLKTLNTDYVDLFLMHSPGNPETRAETWRALEDAVEKGQIKSIGVSNFGIPHIEKLLKTARIKPTVNQIELSPYLQRHELVQYCKEQGIALEAWAPLVKGQKLGDERLEALAKKKGVTPAQVLLRWSLTKGFIPLPKSKGAEHQAENLDVFSFDLDASEIAELDSLEKGYLTSWDPTTQDPV